MASGDIDTDWVDCYDPVGSCAMVRDARGQPVRRVRSFKRQTGGVSVRVLHAAGGSLTIGMTADGPIAVEFEAFIPGGEIEQLGRCGS